jgi:hypothetical protein
MLMMIKLFILLTGSIIVLSNGNMVRLVVGLLLVEMDEEIELIN